MRELTSGKLPPADARAACSGETEEQVRDAVLRGEESYRRAHPAQMTDVERLEQRIAELEAELAKARGES